jgi:hypothetical protein
MGTPLLITIVSLSNDPEASPPQSSDGVPMVDARDLGHS